MNPPWTFPQETSCHPLSPRSKVYQDAAVLAPGIYCVAKNFIQEKLSGAGHTGPGYGHALIEIFGGDVTIDLQGHTLHTAYRSHGLLATSQANQGWAQRENRIFGLHTKKIIVKNGVIDLRGTGTGIFFIDRWDMKDVDENVPSDLVGYKITEYVFDNLLIKTDNAGIILEGGGNIIKNCIIESGGNAAITMAGPNGKIINNTITLANPIVSASMGGVQISSFELRYFSEFFKGRKAHRAAIVLHQADGTVINGNRIEVKGGSETRHNIYLNHGSKDVHIEGNTFVGADDPVTLVDGSTAELKNNVFEKKKVPWWKF